MYKAYFTDAIDYQLNAEYIGEHETFEGACALAIEAIKNKGYKDSPYWRYLLAEDATYIDFGSWSKFLCITPRVTPEDFPT